MKLKLICAHCGKEFEKERGQANRQRRLHGEDVRFFCTQRCCGDSKALHKTKEHAVSPLKTRVSCETPCNWCLSNHWLCVVPAPVHAPHSGGAA